MASASVDILLNAKDNASDKIKKVSDASGGLSSKMGQAGGASTLLKGGMGALLGPVGLVAGALLAAKSASDLAKGAFNAFTNNIGEALSKWAVQEAAMKGNSLALQDFASDLQVLTNHGDETILQMMKLGRGMGVSEENMKSATQAAIGLSQITGQGLDQSMKAVARGTLDNVDAFQRYFPEMEHMTSAAEKQAFVNQKLAEGFDKSKSGTSTLAGALKSLGNNWGDMLEKVGQLFAPFVQKVADWFNRIAPVIQNVIGKVLPIMAAFAAKMQQVAVWIGEKLLYAFTFIEQAVRNWKQVMTIAALTVYGKWLEFKNNLTHIFTVALPGVLKWLADNWMNIFRDMLVAHVTLWRNRLNQIIDIVKVFWDAITLKIGAGEAMLKVGEIAGRNMLEGFKAKTKPLPDLLTRQLTPEEKAIKAATSAMAENFMDGVNKKFEDRKKYFGRELGAGAKEFEALDFGAPEPTGGPADKVVDDKKEKELSLGGMKAEEGRFLSRGRQTTAQQQLQKQDEMIKLLKKQAEDAKRAADAMEEQLNKEDVPPLELTI